jgi:glycerol uptake facilitator-like aquaporin
MAPTPRAAGPRTRSRPPLPPAADVSLARRATAEATGTALLLTAIVGSGIVAERLAGGNVALALLANAIATGGALVAIIFAFGPISGAHLNPAITLADAWQHGIAWRDVPAYIGAQFAGALAGVTLANVMFGLPVLAASHHARGGTAQLVSEALATFGLLAVIWGCTRSRLSSATPVAVACYIIAAYWFTPSTSFANPAVTFARSLTDTFAGIRPTDVLPFIAAQLVGAAAATSLFAWLVPALPRTAETLLLPHPIEDSDDSGQRRGYAART